MSDLFTLGVCQMPVCRNWSELSPILQQAADNGIGLLALPELIVGGFDLVNREQWIIQSAQLQHYLLELSRRSGTAFIGSFWEKRTNAFYNSMKLICGDHVRHLGDKIHLFTPSGENDFIDVSPDAMQPANLSGINIGGAVCYDLRFPEVFRAQLEHDIDVFVVCAQWPLARLEHLQALVKARAIENQAYILLANACQNAPGLGMLAGHSALLSPDGEIIFEMNQTAGLEQAAFDRQTVLAARTLINSRQSRFKTIF